MLARPRQVTIAAWVIIVASVLTVVTVAELFQVLGTVDFSDSVQSALDDTSFAKGITVDQIETTARILGMVAAGCATASVILAWQVMAQRSTQARLALTILAGPLFLSGVVTGGVHTTVAAVAVGFLWTPLARSWFDGTWKPEPVRPAAPTDAPPTRRIGQLPPPPGSRPTAGPISGPTSGPTAGPTVPPVTPPPMASWPPPAHPVPTMPPPQGLPVTQAAVPATAPRSARPGALLAAVILTWIFSVAVAAAFIAGAAVLLSDPAKVIDQARDRYPSLVAEQNLTEDSIRAGVVFLVAIVVLWSLSACVLALFVLLGARWARIVLLVCTGAAALTLLLGLVASVVLVVPLLGAALTFALLMRRDVTDWLR